MTGESDDNPLAKYMQIAINMGASDLHLTEGRYANYTVRRVPHKHRDLPRLTGQDMKFMCMPLTSKAMEQGGGQRNDNDLIYEACGRRLRVNIAKQDGKLLLTGRLISDRMPMPDEIHIPPAVLEWARARKGLVLFTGSTGTGKSTSIDSILQWVARTQSRIIMTVEDPIEYVFPDFDDSDSEVYQRQVGADTEDMHTALVSTTRQALHVQFYGEVREHDEMLNMLRAADTGALVFATIHANEPAAVLDRILSEFTPGEMRMVTELFTSSLLGIVGQDLAPTLDHQHLRAVYEVLEADNETRELFRTSNASATVHELQERRGMLLAQQARHLVDEGELAHDDALAIVPFWDRSLFEEVEP